MKLACPCGNVIYDQTDHLPYKAMLLRDQDWELCHDRIVPRIMDFVAALRKGRRAQWLVEQRMPEMPDNDIIADIITAAEMLMTAVYECEKCGRIFVEGADHKTLHDFTPSDGHYRGVLRSALNSVDGRRSP